jgi:PPE-repeat protein
MYGYAGDSQEATEVTPFAPPEEATNRGGLAAQSAAAAQAAGTSAGQAQSALSGGNAMSAVPNALQTLTSSSTLSEFSNPYDLVSLGSGFLGNGLGLIGLAGAGGFISDAEHKIFGAEEVSASGPSAPQDGAESTERLPKKATTVSAEAGRATSLGRLSVPEGWASAAPEVRLVAQASPFASAVPTPASSLGLFSGMPLFGGAPLMALSGRGTRNSRNRRAEKEIDAPGILVPAGRASLDRVETPGGAGRTTAEMHQMTDLLGKLAQLRDSGALTEREFSEQKQRLLGNR